MTSGILVSVMDLTYGCFVESSIATLYIEYLSVILHTVTHRDTSLHTHHFIYHYTHITTSLPDTAGSRAAILTRSQHE